MKLGTTLLLLCFFLTQTNCTVFFSRSARSAEKADKIKANYQIGYLENRDFRFDPFRVKNFISLLKFEIIRGGNGLVEEGSEQDTSKMNPTPAPTLPNNAVTQNPEAKESASTPITPPTVPIPTAAMQAMTNPEGSKTAIDSSQKENKRILTETEIKSLSGKTNFDYYLQGSFGISDNGSILDRNYTTLIFIDVHDKSGKLVRTVTFSQESKHFSEAEDLKQASISLVDKIMKKQENQESKVWWKFGF
ncbi:lipoprotein [Leptospira yasudae]|uniref:Lipoprotein n=1 Tax=Leptospira yasudae TaxID=2202201 RepID=A0A6N4QH92_9LEPT|nr:lipoprotein [Leptospira yasudae]TGL79171.1 lipoprotein [Leptospira yasudae]TGL83081.1 lipoprotein [Leptospira yasudae]TGL85688.1 lipoprotein [Leptospira yasudae]